jgi:hypothetical protein
MDAASMRDRVCDRDCRWAVRILRYGRSQKGLLYTPKLGPALADMARGAPLGLFLCREGGFGHRPGGLVHGKLSDFGLSIAGGGTLHAPARESEAATFDLRRIDSVDVVTAPQIPAAGGAILYNLETVRAFGRLNGRA